MRVERSETIEHPVSDVFAFYADDHVLNHPRWDPDAALSLATDGAVGIGTVFHRSHPHYGEPAEGTMEVVEFERDQVFGLVIDDGYGELFARLSFEPVSAATTRVSVMIDIPDAEGLDQGHLVAVAERWLHHTEDLIDGTPT